MTMKVPAAASDPLTVQLTFDLLYFPHHKLNLFITRMTPFKRVITLLEGLIFIPDAAGRKSIKLRWFHPALSAPRNKVRGKSRKRIPPRQQEIAAVVLSLFFLCLNILEEI